MNFFDWLTEEDEDQPLNTADFTPTPPRKHGRKFLLLFVTIILITAAIYWQLDRRADAQETLFETDVLAAFSLWQQAIAQNDSEIFNTLLVGAEPVWATGQRSLFATDQILGRSQIGLALSTAENSLNISDVEVNLSADWSTAEISFQQVYNIVDGPIDALTDPRQIQLAQTVAFRRSANRWFSAALPADYWGELKTEEKPLLTVTYPERDQTLALRLAQDLSAELTAVCANLPAGVCDERAAIEIRFETQNSNPTLWRGWETTLVDGRIFLLPAPSLAGQPIDDESYDLLYDRYTVPILSVFTAWADTPIPLPDQELQLICYPPNGRVPKLIRFTSIDEWVIDLPEKSFRYLSPMPTDEGIILQEYLPGQDSSHLRLTLWKNGRETLVYDDDFNHLMLYPVGWSSPATQPNLLLHGYDQFPTLTSYKQLNLDNCDSSGCQVQTAANYPVWSPDGRHTLLQGSGQLFLGGPSAQPEQELGPGVVPFWLDNERFGYVRYITDLDAAAENGRMEIVTADITDTTPRRLLTTKQFTLGLPHDRPDSVYFTYITVNPANPNQLYLALNYYDDQQHDLKIFSVDLDQSAENPALERITFAMSLEGSAVGFPSLAAQNGFVPFTVSSNGRFLTASRPSSEQTDHWIIYSHDTELVQTREYTVAYPSSQFIHPYYDWSKDSNWLIIVEQNYLRLIAPGYGYERLIPHNLQACSHVAWVDPLP